MDRKSIPGFYFDAEKKKYFKILPNHVAPMGAKYSKEGVQRSREGEKKRKRDAEHEALLQKRVQNPKIMQHPLGGSVALSRELDFNSRMRPRDVPGKAYACGLEKSLELREPYGSETGSLTHFARDEVTGGYVMGFNQGGCGLLQSWAPHPPGSGSCNYPDRGKSIMLSDTGSEISSVNISPTRTLIVTMLGGTAAPIIHLSKLVEPIVLEGTWPWLDIGVTVVFRFSNETSVWTSSPSPFSTQSSAPKIALGTSRGVTLLTETPSNWTDEQALAAPSDVFALEWLGANGVIAAGCRNGKVRIYDSRGGEKMAGAGLKHGSAVTAVRRVDDWRIVVSGLESKRNMYDLRFTKPPSGPHRRPRTTTPLLTYPNHTNPYTRTLGFDICTSLNLVVAATSPSPYPSTDQSQQQGTVNLYALHTGEKIRSILPSPPSPQLTDPAEPPSGDAELVKCIRFSNLNQDSRARGLVMARSNVIEEWTW